MAKYGMKGESKRLRLSRRMLDELSRLLDDTPMADGGKVPDSVVAAAADELIELSGRRQGTKSRYVVDLGKLEPTTVFALRECLVVIAGSCCHIQLQTACMKKAAEIANYLNLSAIDRLGDIMRESA